MKQKILLITSIACFFLASASSFAQSSNVWTGGSSTSGNWSDPANWGGSAPASPQAILNFAGSVRTSSTNDFASGSAGYRIFFKSGAGSFTLRGNSINFFDYSGTDSKIENDSSSGQTLAIDITAASFFVPQLEMNPVNGNITNLNPLSLWGSNQLQIWGNNGKIIVFGPGSVINNLGSVAINQNSVVIFQATNTYSGDTYVNAGTLRLATNDATINSIIRLGDLGGTATANLNLDGGLVLTSVINPRLGSSGTKTLANTAGTSGNATYAGNLYLDDNVTVYANSGGGVTLAGSVIDLRGSTLLVDGPAATTISASLMNSTGIGSLVKNGRGTLTLKPATNTFAGLTVVASGELLAQTGGSMSNSAVGVFATNGVQVLSTGGQWVCGGLTYQSGTTYADFDFTSAGLSTTTAPIRVNGDLRFNGTLNVILRMTNSAVAPGYYPLIEYTGTLSGFFPTKVLVRLPSGTPAITANSGKSIGILVGPEVVGWGDDSYGQISPPSDLTNIVAISAGISHTLVLKGNGTVTAWGDNVFGETSVPAGLSNVVAIAASGYRSLALSNGMVVAWGDISYVPIGLSNVVAIAAGGYHSLALKSNGTVVAWGDSSYGQTNVPAGLSNVVAIAAGGYHNLALKSNGMVVAWGAGTNNTCSSLTNGQSAVPAGLSNVVAIAAGFDYSLALKNNGTIAAWGCSPGTNVPAGLSNAVAIAAGFDHAVALKSDGTVIAWGNNYYGQATVPLGLSNTVAITAGESHSLALAPSYLGPFSSGPQSPSVSCGNRLILTVQPTSSSSTYQWQLNGTAIPGAVSPALTFTNVSCTNAGEYSVVVSNAGGSVTISNGVLQVVPSYFQVHCPVGPIVGCTNRAPPPATNLAGFQALGGYINGGCGKVTFAGSSDGLPSVTGCYSNFTRAYCFVDDCGQTNWCGQSFTIDLPPQILGISATQSVQSNGIQVAYCANVLDFPGDTITYSWSIVSGSPIATSQSGNCYYVTYSPTNTDTNVVQVTVNNACGCGASGSGSSATCAICLSRGFPSLLTSTNGSGLGPTNNTSCGPITSTAKWFKMVLTNETGLVTISTEGSSNQPVLVVYTGPITNLSPVIAAYGTNCDTSSANHASRVTFKALKGSVYWIIVDAHTNNPSLRIASGFEPSLTNYSYNANTGFELYSTLAPAITYQLQAATSVVSPGNWTAVLTTNFATNYQVYFRDTNALRFSQRFYRLAAP